MDLWYACRLSVVCPFVHRRRPLRIVLWCSLGRRGKIFRRLITNKSCVLNLGMQNFSQSEYCLLTTPIKAFDYVDHAVVYNKEIDCPWSTRSPRLLV